jgi:hypothetical protein
MVSGLWASTTMWQFSFIKKKSLNEFWKPFFSIVFWWYFSNKKKLVGMCLTYTRGKATTYESNIALCLNKPFFYYRCDCILWHLVKITYSHMNDHKVVFNYICNLYLWLMSIWMKMKNTFILFFFNVVPK